MKLKKVIAMLVFALSLVVLVGCSGSAKIQGKWKSQNADGEIVAIEFKKKTVSLNDTKYNYTQNAIGFEDGVSYYGIEIDGELYSIVFPEKDQNVAIMIQPEDDDHYLRGRVVFAMNRKTQPNFEDYVKKYLNQY